MGHKYENIKLYKILLTIIDRYPIIILIHTKYFKKIDIFVVYLSYQSIHILYTKLK